MLTLAEILSFLEIFLLMVSMVIEDLKYGTSDILIVHSSELAEVVKTTL